MRTEKDVKSKAPRKSTAAAAPKAGKARRAGEGKADDAARISAMLESFAEGHYQLRLDPASFADPTLRRLASAANAVADHSAAELAEARERVRTVGAGVDEAIAAMMRTVVEGDLSRPLEIGVSDAALAPLISGVGQVMETLKRFVLEIRDAVLQLSTGASEVLAAATQNESSMTEQASAVHETTATMEELKGASHQIAENAQTVAAIAEKTLSSAKLGEGAIRSFIGAMERVRSNAVDVHGSMGKLARSVERVGSVVDVIDEIADRSDLLALNAALEGAKAGEAGRGFSIVAAEMRRLAENVMESTKEIKVLITEIRSATIAAQSSSDRNATMAAEGEKLGAAAMENVSGILGGVQETSDAARVIHLATQQQRTATDQVVQSMGEIEEITRQAQSGSRQATGAAAELTNLAERLSELIRRFKVE